MLVHALSTSYPFYMDESPVCNHGSLSRSVFPLSWQQTPHSFTWHGGSKQGINPLLKSMFLVRVHAECFLPFLKSMFMIKACTKHFVHFLKSIFMVKVARCGLCTLSMWFRPWFLTLGNTKIIGVKPCLSLFRTITGTQITHLTPWNCCWYNSFCDIIFFESSGKCKLYVSFLIKYHVENSKSELL